MSMGDLVVELEHTSADAACCMDGWACEEVSFGTSLVWISLT